MLQEKTTLLEETGRNLRDIIVNISADVGEEEQEGTRFRVKNMPNIRDDSRLIGTSLLFPQLVSLSDGSSDLVLIVLSPGRSNVKVNVYINGRDVDSKIVVILGGTFKPTLDWFLEECEKVHRDTLG